MPHRVFGVMGVSLLSCVFGCQGGHYSVYVTNGSSRDINDVSLLDQDRGSTTRFGSLVSGQSGGFGPFEPRSIPSMARLSWKESGTSHEYTIQVPEAIRKRIKGRGEDLYFVIREDRSVVVYVEIPTRDLTKPRFYPSDLSPK